MLNRNESYIPNSRAISPDFQPSYKKCLSSFFTQLSTLLDRPVFNASLLNLFVNSQESEEDCNSVRVRWKRVATFEIDKSLLETSGRV